MPFTLICEGVSLDLYPIAQALPYLVTNRGFLIMQHSSRCNSHQLLLNFVKRGTGTSGEMHENVTYLKTFTRTCFL